MEEFETRLLLSADGLDAFVPLAGEGADQDANATLIVDQSQRPGALQYTPSADLSGHWLRRDLVVIDAGIQGREQIAEALLAANSDDPALSILLLDGNRDGVAQIGEALAGSPRIDALHIVSHGRPGGIDLGSSTLTTATLNHHQEDLAQWRGGLAGGADILLYGCDVAADETGRQLAVELARLTGADVTASDDPTGPEALGGDWALEFATGRVETETGTVALAMADWQGVLATETWYIDSAIIPVGSLKASAPDPTSTLGNFDPARNSDQGLTLKPSSMGLAETDPTRYQLWLTSAGGQNIAGDASLTLWSGVETFKTSWKGAVSVYLVDSNADGSDLTEIASASLAEQKWHSRDGEPASATWMEDQFDLGSIDHDFAVGRYLGIKLVVDDYAIQDMWFAYDSSQQPSRLEIVEPVNQSPSAADDSGAGFATDADRVLVTADVRANDSDPDTGDTLSVLALDTTGTRGLVSDRGDGTFSYDPNGQFTRLAQGATATDTFRYTLSDGQGGTASATVTIQITGANDDPSAADDSGAGFAADADRVLVTADVRANDSDPDTGDTLSVLALDTTGTRGLVSDRGDGTFSYDPNGQFTRLAQGATATDTFRYTLSDGQGGTASATVTIQITGANHLPLAADDQGTGFATAEDTPLLTASVFANDTAGDGDLTLAAHDFETAAGGKVAHLGEGRFSYQPPANFHGQDSFSYTLADADGETSVAQVIIEVASVNDLPRPGVDHYTIDADQRLSPDDEHLLANDSDPDGDPLTVNPGPVSSPAHGTLTLHSDGRFSYRPDPGFSGSDSFGYEVLDGQGGRATATVTITVIGSPVTPVPMPETPDSAKPPPPTAPAPAAPPAADSAPQSDLERSDSGDQSGGQREPATLGGGSRPGQPQAEASSEPELAPPEVATAAQTEALFNQLLGIKPADAGGPSSGFNKLSGGGNLVPKEHQIWQGIASMNREIEEAFADAREITLLHTPLGAATAVGFSAGTMGWILRGSALFASMLSFLPVWSGFDPLPIVAGRRRRKEKTPANERETGIFGLEAAGPHPDDADVQQPSPPPRNADS